MWRTSGYTREQASAPARSVNVYELCTHSNHNEVKYLPSSVIRVVITACGHLFCTAAQNASSVLASSLSEIAHATGLPK